MSGLEGRRLRRRVGALADHLHLEATAALRRKDLLKAQVFGEAREAVLGAIRGPRAHGGDGGGLLAGVRARRARRSR